MKKRILSIIMAFCLIASLLPTVALAADNATISATKNEVKAGETFDVSLVIPNITDKLAYSASFAYSFDNSVFEVVNFSAPAIGDVSADGENSADGNILCTYTGVKGGNTLDFSSGLTITATFKVKDDATPGSYSFVVDEENTFAYFYNEETYEDEELFTIPNNLKTTVTVGSAGSEDPEIPTNVTYTADLDTTSTAVKVGDEVTVNILVGGTSNQFASSELNLTYNGLTYTGATANGADIDTSVAGKIKIIDHGESTSWTEGNTVTAYTLNFTVDSITGASGTASVTLSDAALSTDEQAVGNNLTIATITTGTKTFTVTPADLKVIVPGELTASGSAEEKTVVYGQSFVIEAADKNYDYELSAKVTGTETSVEITPDSTVDGKWTIASVTDNVTITVKSKTPKSFKVTIDTADNFETAPTTGDKAATYMTPYTFTLKANEAVKENGESGWTYSVDKITIGGQDYTATNEGQVYTIAGEAITGDIVITTKKTEVKPDEYTITVNRTDVSADELVVSPADKVATDGSITLTLNPVAGYTYTVTYKFGDGEAQNVTWTDGENGVKTATISDVTGNVTISASKAVNKNDITVSVDVYLALNGKTMYLVQVTSKLVSGYVYTYSGANMYFSNEYNKDNGGAYVYLVINDADDTLTDEAALAQISIAQGNVAATVDYSGDVNMATPTKVDANDAQLVWNMYSAKTYSDFTTVNMEKFLRADVDKNGDVDVDDASAIVTLVKNRTN